MHKSIPLTANSCQLKGIKMHPTVVERNAHRAKSKPSQSYRMTQTHCTNRQSVFESTNLESSYQPLLTQETRNHILSCMSQDYSNFRKSTNRSEMSSHRLKTAQPNRSIHVPPTSAKSMHQNDIDYKRLQYIDEMKPQPIVLKRKISQESIMHDGKKVPFKLYLRNQMRKSWYQDVMKMKDQANKSNDNISTEMLRNEIHQKLKPEQDKLMSTIFQSEKQKRHREYRTRSAYNNPYCSILAMNQKSKNKLRIQLMRALPIESRFQIEQFDYDELDKHLLN